MRVLDAEPLSAQQACRTSLGKLLMSRIVVNAYVDKAKQVSFGGTHLRQKRRAIDQ